MSAPQTEFAVALTSRTLDNYAKHGKTPPADSVLMPCQCCGLQMAISPASVEKGNLRATESGRPLIVICQSCYFLAVPSGKPGTIELSQFAAKSIHEPTVRPLFDALMQHIRPYDPSKKE